MSDILKTTNRLPYTEAELSLFVGILKQRLSKNNDLQLGDGNLLTEIEHFISATKDGLCFSFSPQQLKVRFLFVKCNAGKGLLGGQKSVYNSYLQYLGEETWSIGPVFKMWAVAGTSIGNVYRGNGF